MKLLLSLIVLVLISGCGPTYHEAKQQLSTSANPYEICLAAGDPRMFSDEKKKAALDLVHQRGHQCDWQAVASYWQGFMNNAMAGFSNSVQMMQQSQWQTPQAFQSSVNPAGNYNSVTGTTVQQNGAITQQGAGRLVDQSAYGSTRYCYYNNLGKITSIQIATSQMCPQKN